MDTSRVVAIFVSLFVAIFLPFFFLMVSGKQWRAADDKAGERRLAEAKMNARLLKFNI